MGYTREIRSNKPDTTGTDFRVEATDARHNLFYTTSYTYSALRDERIAEVEVQAFHPALAGNGVSQEVIVGLVVKGTQGYTDIMLSPDEARQVAMALLASSREAIALR